MTQGWTSASTLVTGTVIDASDSRPIRSAQIALDNANRSMSDASGQFSFEQISAGAHVLTVVAEGYRSVTADVTVPNAATAQFKITLVRTKLEHSEVVSVQAVPTDTIENTSAGVFSLEHGDLENLATVLADDPLRAVQAVPGVESNDDFSARFSLRGADFSRVGLYFDGVLLHTPLHGLEGTDLNGSASVFNANLISSVQLYEGDYPERYADTSAGVLSLNMRDPSPSSYSMQLEVNLAAVSFSASGPLLDKQRCAWIAGARKSYLQYLIAKSLDDPSMAFGIEDQEGRVSCRVSQQHTIAVDVIDSHTGLDRSSVKNQLGDNSLMLAGQHTDFVNVSWLYAPAARLAVQNHFAWMSDSFGAQNPSQAYLGEGDYREFAWNSDGTWQWTSGASSSVGMQYRDIRASGFEQQYDTFRGIALLSNYRGSDDLLGGFLEQTFAALHGRVHGTVSARWDRDSILGTNAISPQGALGIRLRDSLELQFGWARYTQFPEVSVLTSNLAGPGLQPAHSDNATVSLEQRLPAHVRLRADYYARRDANLVYQPYVDPRVLYGEVFVPPVNPAYTSSLSGDAHGVEITVQRSSEQRLSGWISYAYGHTWQHDAVSGASFVSDWDQRHTANAYLTYRVRPTLNVSARWTYGSGFPVPGFLTELNGNFYLSEYRNQYRLGPYQRLDFRVNKTWKSERWKKTLYAEVMNVTNKTNLRFGSLDGYALDRFAYVSIDTMFPILPSVGFVLER